MASKSKEFFPSLYIPYFDSFVMASRSNVGCVDDGNHSCNIRRMS